uniref:G-protein coupled receptors family 1 profile domain-containing protein n=1 Tax=Globodera rostochiensis TaxID=31243 RepID=A0A914IF38_GLORO
MSLIIGCLLIIVHFCNASFLVTDYPNPLNKATLWKCGISSVGTLCDPDSLLNNTARQEALELLKQFKDQTDINNNGDGTCKSKGVTIGLALTRQPITARNARINVTDDLMKNIWKLDTQCNKALMLTLSINPNPVVRFTRYMTTPVFDDELHHMIWTEMHWLRERNYIMWTQHVEQPAAGAVTKELRRLWLRHFLLFYRCPVFRCCHTERAMDVAPVPPTLWALGWKAGAVSGNEQEIE